MMFYYERFSQSWEINNGAVFETLLNKVLREANEYDYWRKKMNNKVTLELEEEHRILVEMIEYCHDISMDMDDFFNKSLKLSGVCVLADEWFGSTSVYECIKTIERIHSADEIKFVEAKKYWKLQNEYRGSVALSDGFGIREDSFGKHWDLYCFKENCSQLTESEFKQVLRDTHCPIDFDKWVGVEV